MNVNSQIRKTGVRMSIQRLAGYAAFLLLVERGAVSFDSFGRAVRDGKIASRANRNGYRRIPFRHCGHRFEIMEHVAYYIWATGKWPRKRQQVNHRDLDRSNGTLSNLELVSQSENLRHSHAMRRAGAKGGKR